MGCGGEAEECVDALPNQLFSLRSLQKKKPFCARRGAFTSVAVVIFNGRMKTENYIFVLQQVAV